MQKIPGLLGRRGLEKNRREARFFLPPNFILGMKRNEGTEAFGVGSTAVAVGVGRFVGVPGEIETK